MLLQGKTTVVYGAAGAIGSHIARAFSREGAKVLLTGRDKPPLDGLAKEISATGGVVDTSVVDALDPHAVETHVSRAIEKHGRIDVSCNVIMIPHRQGTPFIDMTLEDFQHPIKDYAATQFVTATSAARRMVKQGSGVILMVTAPLGHVPSALAGAFGIACALIEAFSRNLAAEVGPRGVRVVCLRTSGSPESQSVQESLDRLAKTEGKSREAIRSKFEQSSSLRRMTSLNEIANVAALVASDLASPITATSVNSTCGGVVD